MTAQNNELDADIGWMRRALDLAENGRGLCSPNPTVGCVIVDRNGQVAGKGWHEYDLRDHAEVVALKIAGERARGGTAFVTLEPCNHFGRTGPCSHALIDAGVARVVAATSDPNPQVAGQGFETLRRAGVAVVVGPCQGQARRLNEGFACWIQSRKPLVLMKVAMSLDGKIAPPHHRRLIRETYWITGEASRAAVQQMRWQADAVMTGVNSVIDDDPLLTDRSGRPRRRKLLRVVLDSHLRIPLDSKLVSSAESDLVVFTVCRDEARMEALRRKGVRVEVLPDRAGRVPIESTLTFLGAEGILTLMTETGSTLNTALLAGEFVDRIKIFYSPQIMGSDAMPAFGPLEVQVMVDAAEVERHSKDVSVSALIRDPWEI